MYEWLVSLRLPLSTFPMHLVMMTEDGGMGAAMQAHVGGGGGGGLVLGRSSSLGRGQSTEGAGEEADMEMDLDEEEGGGDMTATDSDEELSGSSSTSARSKAIFVRRKLSLLVPLACLASQGDPKSYRFDLVLSLAMSAGLSGIGASQEDGPPAPGGEAAEIR